MALVETIEISGEEREIADAVARDRIDGINSNLTDLAFGENSGSANIFNGKIVGGLLIETGEVGGWTTTRITSDFIPVEPNTLYTQIAPTSAKKGRYCEYDANKNIVYFDDSGLQDTFTTKPTTKYLRISFGSEYGTTFKNDIAIIKGNATEYVPYIMSNKQLGALNESLEAQGLDNKFDGILFQGFFDTNGAEGNPTQSNAFVVNKNPINVSDGDIINVKYSGKETTTLFAQFYKSDGSNNGIVMMENGSNIDSTFAVPADSKTMHINIGNSDGISLNDVSSLYVSVNNEIAELKNDLSAVQSNTILNYESTTVDLNSLTGHPLIASVNTGATNAPTGFGGGYMIVVYAGSSSAALYQTLADVVNNKTYRRSLYHGSWSDWSLTAQ